MYGHITDVENVPADSEILDNSEEFEQLKSQYPEHEIYLFFGNKVDMALFTAPGVSAVLIESRASPEEI